MPELKYPNLASALAAFQADMPKVDKSKTANIPGRPSYSYADLKDITDEVMPRLAAVGLAFLAGPSRSTIDGAPVLAWELLHTSGESRTGEWPLGDIKTQQAGGSALTYSRRYCLCSVTGVVAEDDDDGAHASAPTQRQQQRSGRGQQRQTSAPADEDGWPEAAKPGGGASQNENRRRAMMAEFARVKLPDGSSLADDKNRDERLKGIGKVIGKTVASSSDLTPAQVEDVIRALKARRAAVTEAVA